MQSASVKYSYATNMSLPWEKAIRHGTSLAEPLDSSDETCLMNKEVDV